MNETGMNHIAVMVSARRLARLAKCSKCGRRYRAGAKDADLWNVTFDHGVVTGFTCPACQTDAQDLEAAVNEALTDYSRMTLRDGRAYAPAREPEATA